MAKGVRLKGIKRITSKGKTYVYRRVRGKLIPLPADLPENHPDFLAAYLDAERHVTRDGTLASLVESFLASQDLQRRKASTRAVWRRRLDHIRATYGAAPVAKLTPAHVNAALRKLTPGAARSERTIWRGLLAFAVVEGWRHDNPAAGAIIAKAKVTPHATWTPGDVARFRQHWPIGSGERQAMEVLFWTAARCSDAATIGWQNVAHGLLTFTQAKTGDTAVVPITAPVQAELERDRRFFLDAAGPDLLFITTATGRARSVKGLSQYVAKAARAAGLTSKTAHGLRKARAVALAESGWTPHEIGAWTGHESLTEIAHYTRDRNKAALVSVKPTGKPALQVVESPNKTKH